MFKEDFIFEPLPVNLRLIGIDSRGQKHRTSFQSLTPSDTFVNCILLSSTRLMKVLTL